VGDASLRVVEAEAAILKVEEMEEVVVHSKPYA
jgi:hypothetical protein